MLLRLAGMFAALAVLAGCGETSTRYPIACPRPAILGEGADLTRYRPGGPAELASLVSDAKLTGVAGGCARGQNAIEMKLAVGFSADRGPAAGSREIELPWFVAIVDNRSGRVLTERDFVIVTGFGPNETSISGMSPQVDITLPVGAAISARDYTVYVAFRLTPEQLANNRRRGVR